MSPRSSREFHLLRRPGGLPAPSDFGLRTVTLPEPADGELLVRNQFLSVDPYMRGRMTDAKSYLPPFALDAPLEGGAVGVVEQSRHPRFHRGDTVLSMMGWREAFVSDGKGVHPVDPRLAPAQAYLGALGMPGLTAYAGLTVVGGLTDGETVLVSGAAGAVGMIACQIAKARGCRVIAVAGSAPKIEWLERVAGVDVAINYRTVPSLRKAFAAAAPEGIHLTFENVGGDNLEAALAASRPFGRIVLCGLISQYNATAPGPGIRNVAAVLVKRLTVRGFIVSDHADLRPAFQADMARWIAEGRMHWEETIVDGFERMPEAFLGLFDGTNLGKMVVRLIHEESS